LPANTETPASPGNRRLRVVRRHSVSWAEAGFFLFAAVTHGWALTKIHLVPDLGPNLPKWFDLTFGIPSPTSGTTRAILALDRGDVPTALMFHPVATVVAAFGWGFLAYLPVSKWTGWAIEADRRLERWTLWLTLLAIFTSWICKLLFLGREWW